MENKPNYTGLLLIGGLAVGGYLFYNYYTNKNTSTTPTTPQGPAGGISTPPTDQAASNYAADLAYLQGEIDTQRSYFSDYLTTNHPSNNIDTPELTGTADNTPGMVPSKASDIYILNTPKPIPQIQPTQPTQVFITNPVNDAALSSIIQKANTNYQNLATVNISSIPTAPTPTKAPGNISLSDPINTAFLNSQLAKQQKTTVKPIPTANNNLQQAAKAKK